jgi:A/G-specific adenine glycosylase
MVQRMVNPATLADRVETWFAGHARDLPWRHNRDAWSALVSEIMLQQTQANRVAERFDAVMRMFPTPSAMAAAPIDALLLHWQGLGYYRRARNLHAAANHIVEAFDGRTPDDAPSLLMLPGVGRYTAGSIASIAGGHREAIVDGNVRRVLCRVFGDGGRVGDRALEQRTWARAQELVEACTSPAHCNEGLMELGATICTPRAPRCDACPLSACCKARQMGSPEAFPKPKAPTPRPVEHVTCTAVLRGRRVLLEQRPADGRWASTWQVHTHIAEVQTAGPGYLPDGIELPKRHGGFDHILTHRHLRVRVFSAWALHGARLAGARRRWVDLQSPDVPLSSLMSKVLVRVRAYRLAEAS